MSGSHSNDEDDVVQVPETSSPTKVASSSPLKPTSPTVPDASVASLRSRFTFKPSDPSEGAHTSKPLPSGSPEVALVNLAREFPDFSQTLVQAVFKSNSFNLQSARERLTRLRQQRQNWTWNKNASPKKSETPPPVKKSLPLANTGRLSSIHGNINNKSSKITVAKQKTSIFDRYSNVINQKQYTFELPTNLNIDSEALSKLPVNYNKKRRLVRADQHPIGKSYESSATQLGSAREKLLANRKYGRHANDNDEEEEESMMTDDDDASGDDYTESTPQINLDEQVLQFINDSDIVDLSDLSDTTMHKAQLIASHRPYSSLNAFVNTNFNDRDTEENASNKRKRRAAASANESERLLDKITQSIRGYNAIESVIKKCSSYGDLVTSQMKKWGVQVEGDNSELDLMNLGEDDDDDNDDGNNDKNNSNNNNTAGADATSKEKEDTKAVVEGFDETSAEPTPAPAPAPVERETKRTRNTTKPKVVEDEDDDVDLEAIDDELPQSEHEDDDYEEEDEDYNDEEEDVEYDDGDDDDDDDDEFVATRKNTHVVSTTSRNGRKPIVKFFKGKPRLLSPEISLKDYQQTGINWLNLLYQNKMSCILADDMGLGKTCQVISFFAYLKQINEPGPHLVVVPSSTLENWLREFQKFAPALKIEPYYGSLQEREELRDILERNAGKYDVIVTTYNLAAGNKYDVSFLKNRNFNVVVYDEGHMLKNSTSERFAKLMKIRANFRLLLTGTPLQNNLKELMSLLEFIMPNLFISKKESFDAIFKQRAKTTDDNKNHNPLLAQEAITRAKTMMKPFILRRRKDQVLKHLPPKHTHIQYCELNAIQKKIYDKEIQIVLEHKRMIKDGELPKDAKEKSKLQSSSSKNLIMALRKASLHPLLFRNIYNDKIITKMSDAILDEPAYAENGNKEYIKEDMSYMTDFELHKLCCNFPNTLSKYQLHNDEWMQSGKIDALKKLLKTIIVDKQEKVLIFSLFTQVLDILEMVLSTLDYKFLRLDGSTQVNDRQLLIDKFYEDKDIPIFILSTKAGGFGINLVCANNVIIFDQSFNPHDDRQAADRAHRVGQTKEVNITTLITKDSIEEKIHQLAKNKLALDSYISEDKKSQDVLESKVSDMLEDIIYDENSKPKGTKE
ncbi:AVN_HP_G0095960.mRNA.1.CDS.1 [Saccharomyces cerevisiae]|nr:ANL_HP_G0018880.mRNA.1.CDS.1 [Saccharomyces cerevisiae]CAI4978244.1 ANL_HP_G0037200.mRNA.1.CDS.1 [Saccharomyces cerevisiae]CAI4980651.1 ANL_HP_G0039110.mRNA.1.CDS.1 [Saccharomyces cerevisiae]CAI5098351.1 AVN_HP_G0095960.mRNA.1.CDS.1 [Saccharomyces cerevisiae]CAI6609236.1 ANL_HP_G0018880.mRNA.1.CDS.1 [Saccharomyces cerevisiae]